MEKEIKLSNWRVSFVGCEDASKGKESGKGEEQVKYNLMSEGDCKQPMLLQDLSEEGATEVDQNI